MVKCRDSHSLGPWSTCSVALRQEKRCCVRKRSSIQPLHQGTERSSCRAERCPPPRGGSADARPLGLVPQAHSSLSRPTPGFPSQEERRSGVSNNGPQVRSDDSAIIHSMHQSIVQRKDEGWLLQSLWSGRLHRENGPLRSG